MVIKKYLLLFSCIVILYAACTFGTIPNKNLAKSNIDFVELSFSKNSKAKNVIRLDTSKFELLSKILKDRKDELVNPSNCYVLHIKLKDGGELNYLTDGTNFQGFDDSSDLPFSFSTKTNIVKSVFSLQAMDSSK